MAWLWFELHVRVVSVCEPTQAITRHVRRFLFSLCCAGLLLFAMMLSIHAAQRIYKDTAAKPPGGKDDYPCLAGLCYN